MIQEILGIQFVRRTAGWTSAGAVVRWDDEAWGVIFPTAYTGRWYRTPVDAQVAFQDAIAHKKVFLAEMENVCHPASAGSPY